MIKIIIAFAFNDHFNHVGFIISIFSKKHQLFAGSQSNGVK